MPKAERDHARNAEPRRTSEVRARRLAAGAAVSDIELVPLDEVAALMCARMRVHLAESGGRAGVK
jgi:hypothetical protein